MIRDRIAPLIRSARWPALAAALALIPLCGAFSTTHVFFVRDLGVYFWPRHLWLRRTWESGQSPLWDPYSGGGQPAVADALNQFFLLPVTAVRVFAPDVAGFNFWIAAPFPVVAVGAWLWLRHHASPVAALVGAAICVLAGPVASTGNFPNLSWSVACIPWTLWATDRVLTKLRLTRIATLALLAGLQAVAGEPVTLAATGVLLLAYALVDPERIAAQRRAVAKLAAVAGGLVAGALLSAVQVLPLLSAAARSPRGSGIDSSFWSLHPVAIGELLVPRLFGHAYDGVLSALPWVTGLNGREPLFFTLYVGLGAFVLAMIRPAGAMNRRRCVFWWSVAAAALVCALGGYTPVYPALQQIVPVLQTFRFPVKYLVFCILALAALAAGGVDAIRSHLRGDQAIAKPRAAVGTAGVIGGAALAVALVSAVRPEWALWWWTALARLSGIADPPAAARWILEPSTARLLGVGALGAAAALLVSIVWQRHRLAPIAAVVLGAVAVLDPMLATIDLHPTIEASRLGPPAWVPLVQAHPGDRVYVGGRVRRLSAPAAARTEYLDAPREFEADASLSPQEATAVVSAQFAYNPAAWGIRESVSYDLASLWPREYAMLIDRFRWAERDDRLRFLSRSGVRYCFLPEPPFAGAPPLAPPAAPTRPMALYVCNPAPQRVYLTTRATLEPDVRRQIDLMFSAAHDPLASVLLERDPPQPAGEDGAAAPTPGAAIVAETNTSLTVRAEVGPGGAYLNVLDTYEPAWRVEVDGQPAMLLRGNGLYRAVRLAPGVHDVRFTYEPDAFYAGLGISSAAALLLLAGCAATALTRRHPARSMRQAVS